MNSSAKSTRTFSARTVLSLVAAGLLGSSILTTSVMVVGIAPAFAATIPAIDPTKGFSKLVEYAMPAVASVEVQFEETAAEMGHGMAPGGEVPPQLKEFFEKFPQFRDRFNGQQGPQQRGSAVGSAFVISADGYVVTNNHVVSKADKVKLRFQNGDEFDAKVIGADAKTDVALLKIDTTKTLPFVTFASVDSKVGDWVMAVGNPFGLGGTVTAGIVSARGRDLGAGPYDDYLQIDASINKGNSGGPAFNLEGEVVGVNTAIYSPSGGSVGIGFAIPANIVSAVVESLKTNGSVTRGWLGVQIQPVTADLAESLGLDKVQGAIISDVTQDSPALKSGLKQGDTILKANGEDIDDAKDLSRTVAGVKPGTEIPVEVIRDGKRQTIAVNIGTMPGEMPKMASTGKGPDSLDLSSLGIKVVPAEDGAGLRVTELDPKSAAAETGLRPGDIILEVAGQHVASQDDLGKAMEKAKGKKVLMLVRTGDSQRFITLPKAKS